MVFHFLVCHGAFIFCLKFLVLDICSFRLNIGYSLVDIYDVKSLLFVISFPVLFVVIRWILIIVAWHVAQGDINPLTPVEFCRSGADILLQMARGCLSMCMRVVVLWESACLMCQPWTEQ